MHLPMSLTEPTQLAAAWRHLAEDAVMGELLAKLGEPEMNPLPAIDQYFGRVARSILFQQISGHAANAILRRVLAAAQAGELTPDGLATLGVDGLRACGVSNQKARYLLDLSEKSLDGTIEFDGLAALSEQEVAERLTMVKGVGRWTAHMFLMFTLGRPDILPVDDQGIRTAIRRAYALDALPKPVEMERIAEPWRPYRTYACCLLWNSVDTKL
jgi:DNA-3-methyladenine glycosylase II